MQGPAPMCPAIEKILRVPTFRGNGGIALVKFLDLFELKLPEILDNQYGEFLVLLLLWTIIGLAVVIIVRPLIHGIFAKTKTDVDDRIIRIVDMPVIIIIFFYGIIQSTRVLDVIPDWFRDGLFQLYTVLVAIVVVYLAYKIFKTVFIPLGTEFSKKRKAGLEEVVLPMIDTIVGVVVIIIGILWILTLVGVNVTVFLAGIGVAGLVLAFALQDTLSNFFSGLHLMLDRPFKIGDTLQIGEDYCTVRSIGFRSTRVYNIFEHDIVIMPNNMIANERIVNLTEPDLNLRLSVEVGVAYGSPVKKVKEILLEAVTSQEGVVLDDPEMEPSVRFTNFGNNALEFKITFFIKDVFEQWRITTAGREHIDDRFKEEGITIPFPQRTLSFLGQGPGQEVKVKTAPQGEVVEGPFASDR